MKHLTELDLSLLGDGRPMNDEARTHLESCEECMARLGDALLEAGDLQSAMASAPIQNRFAKAKAPTLWIALVSAMGITGALLLLRSVDVWLLEAFQTSRAIRRIAPVVAKGLFATGGLSWALLLVAGSLVMFLAFALSKRLLKA